MPKFYISYRGEFETEVEADDEDEALEEAENSENWRFILAEGHKDFFEITDIKHL